ncbi:MAG: pyridoxamine 5'-phosphate oxidase family protein [Rhizobacter sp.]
MTLRLSSLPEIEAAIWIELGRSVRDKQHAWRTPVLATTDGEHADARVVVLREAAPGEKHLLVYTDHRSAKAAQIKSHPLGTLVMWSPVLGWQLRCQVRLTLDTSGLAVTSRWAQIKLSPAAQDYLSPLPPGSPLAEAGEVRPDPSALGHFAVVHGAVLAIDWLELHPEGQRRAVFDAAGARWVQP